MSLEYYLGIAIGILVIVLLGLALKGGQRTREVVRHNGNGTDQLVKQLSRIADSLEILVAHLKLSPPIEKLSVSLQNAAVEPSDADQGKIEQPSASERHINLSMFGR